MYGEWGTSKSFVFPFTEDESTAVDRIKINAFQEEEAP